MAEDFLSQQDEMPLGDLLDRAAADYPAREAIVYKGRRINYAEFKQEADQFAKGLIRLGIKRGDHVVLWMPNLPEWNFANLALAKLGAVTVTCNSRYKAFEVEYLMRQSDSVALIMVDKFLDIDYIRILREIYPEIDRDDPGHLNAAKAPLLKNIILLGSDLPRAAYPFDKIKGLGQGISSEELKARQGEVKMEDPVEMLYTSGTTGAPKGCMLSHRAMFYKCSVFSQLHDWTYRDTNLVAVPYFHIFGAMGMIAGSVMQASGQVLMDVFTPKAALELLEKERITMFSGVPTMFITILGDPEFSEYDLSALRTGTIGAAPVPIEIMKKVIDKTSGMGMDATVVYGLTESTGGTHWTRLGDPIEKRVSTVGRATPEIIDKIVDINSDKELPPGEEGEICIKGPTLMLGYYKKSEATTEKIRDGWLYTGDLGIKDKDGYLKITGRVSDMIIVGGFNTYPAEIENFYLTNPKILDISIVGVPDEKFGEVVMAYVIPKEGNTLAEQEVIDYAKGKIANFKVPRYVEIVKEFPMTGSGKVQKFKQRDMAMAKYNLKKVETA